VCRPNARRAPPWSFRAPPLSRQRAARQAQYQQARRQRGALCRASPALVRKEASA
jgi:hypothetical protein